MSSNSDFQTKWRHTWKWKQIFICNLSKGTKRIHSRTELCTVKKENVGEPDIVIFKIPLEPPPPGTPMRPQVCLIYSGDLYQYHRPKDFFKSNFEGKSNVLLAALSHSRIGNYFFSHLLTCEVHLIEVSEIMAQIQ